MSAPIAGSASRPAVALSSSKATSIRADVLIIGISDAIKALPPGDEVGDAFGRKLGPLLSTLGFKGKGGQIAKLPSSGVVRAPLVIAVGLGTVKLVTPETLRRATATAIRAVHNAASVAIALPAPDAASVQAIAEGALLGGYSYDRFRTEKETDQPKSITLLTGKARSADGKASLERALVNATAVARTRDWVNTPPGDLTPPLFADEVVAVAKDSDAAAKVKVTVWDQARLEKESCGGIVGVGRGSDSPPRLVQISYKPRKPVAHLALVGKGITFDSGGLSIKPGASMMTMKCDMAGAATVISATLAIAELGLPIRVTCFASMAENMVNGSATRPGDVLTIRGGKTVEVHNTDAEGRLVLADALVLATEAKPDLIVDVATLTGACVVALGDRTAGVLSNDEVLHQSIPKIANTVGESMWPLPITEEMRGKVRSSDLADLRQHNPKPIGGTLYAAAFLREFVGEVRWAHLDIAGPAFNDDSAYDYTPKGGTGVSVRTLVQLANTLADGDLG